MPHSGRGSRISQGEQSTGSEAATHTAAWRTGKADARHSGQARRTGAPNPAGKVSRGAWQKHDTKGAGAQASLGSGEVLSAQDSPFRASAFENLSNRHALKSAKVKATYTQSGRCSELVTDDSTERSPQTRCHEKQQDPTHATPMLGNAQIRELSTGTLSRDKECGQGMNGGAAMLHSTPFCLSGSKTTKFYAEISSERNMEMSPANYPKTFALLTPKYFFCGRNIPGVLLYIMR